MKKILAVVLAMGFVGVCSYSVADEMASMTSTTPVAKKTVTVRGILVDLACYLDDGDSGNDHMGMKACGTACLNQGSPAGLLVGSQLYILIFPAANFANYVGKTVEIKGDLYGDTNLIPGKAFVVEADGKKQIPWTTKPMM